uniref:hypothetical protein n=1 Tax=Enterocloster clostridioformis TaxID=1531 RepID=UPI0026EDC23D|nr:hypothetical protein [Enterocloster clostridioformis]
MSIFGIGTNAQETDNGELKGQMFHIACMAWFPAYSKDPIPVSFKFMGEDGSCQSVKDISIIEDEEKNYSGIPSREYKCKAFIGGLEQIFKLVYFTEEYKWVMVI